VLANVVPQFSGPVRSYTAIKQRFAEFCEQSPELWAFYAGYDWWLIAQLYGGFDKMPEGAKHVNDIKSLSMLRKRHNFPHQRSGEHHALYDARWNKLVFEYVMAETDDD
jgi:hypothetical protein